MILVIGDVMRDAYLFGSCDRVSTEAPVPIIVEERMEYRFGGAGNVAENITALGEDVVLASVIGDQQMLEKPAEWFLFQDGRRKTTQKMRIMSGGQQIVRIDTETIAPISGRPEKDLVKFIGMTIRTQPSVIVVSDYGKGVISNKVWMEIIKGSRNENIQLIVDPGRPDFVFYEGAHLLTPNEREYQGWLAWSATFGPGQQQALRRAEPPGVGRLAPIGASGGQPYKGQQGRSGGPNILVTKGSSGMTLLEDGEMIDVPAIERDVVDVTGAGDTVIAAIACHVARNGKPASWLPACRFANAAASVAVGKQGTATVTVKEIPEH